MRGGPSGTREEVLKRSREKGPEKMSCEAKQIPESGLEARSREYVLAFEVVKEVLGGRKEVPKRDHERSPQKT